MAFSEVFSKVALLIDGDNVPPHFAGQILRKAEQLGPLKVRRIYGNVSRIPKWEQAPSYRVVHAGSAKNGADILLSMDAIELALGGNIDAFAIASSDRDFSHAAHRLRELGAYVFGLGEATKVPDHFRKACDRFEELRPPSMPRDNAPADGRILEVLEAIDTTGEGALVTKFNAQMRRRHEFKISEQPEKTWAAYFKARPDRFVLIGQGSERRVRMAIDTEGS